MVRFAWPGWLLGLLAGIGSPGAAQANLPPPRVELKENYPNPFFPATTIPFTISQEVCARGHQPVVSLKIYNTLGQEVATLVDGFQSAGYHSVTWNGRNSAGNTVSTGIYLYRLSAGEVVRTARMILSK